MRRSRFFAGITAGRARKSGLWGKGKRHAAKPRGSGSGKERRAGDAAFRGEIHRVTRFGGALAARSVVRRYLMPAPWYGVVVRAAFRFWCRLAAVP